MNADLSHTRQELQTSEKERSLLQLSLDTLTQDGQAQRADLERKAKGLAADLQKAQQQRDAHGKDLVSTKESLGKVNKAMKETQGQLDSERRGSKAALEEKVSVGIPRMVLYRLHQLRNPRVFNSCMY